MILRVYFCVKPKTGQFGPSRKSRRRVCRGYKGVSMRIRGTWERTDADKRTKSTLKRHECIILTRSYRCDYHLRNVNWKAAKSVDIAVLETPSFTHNASVANFPV